MTYSIAWKLASEKLSVVAGCETLLQEAERCIEDAGHIHNELSQKQSSVTVFRKAMVSSQVFKKEG